MRNCARVMPPPWRNAAPPWPACVSARARACTASTLTATSSNKSRPCYDARRGPAKNGRRHPAGAARLHGVVVRCTRRRGDRRRRDGRAAVAAATTTRAPRHRLAAHCGAAATATGVCRVDDAGDRGPRRGLSPRSHPATRPRPTAALGRAAGGRGGRCGAVARDTAATACTALHRRGRIAPFCRSIRSRAALARGGGAALMFQFASLWWLLALPVPPLLWWALKLRPRRQAQAALFHPHAALLAE